MRTDFATLTKILRASTDNSVALYENKSSYPKNNAQQNLAGRTHYADDSTLRFFHARILSSRPLLDGALFLVIESSAMDYRNEKRGFRFVVFDIFGNVIERRKLEDSFSTRAGAEKDFSKWFATFDVEQYYAETLAARHDRLVREATVAREAVAALSSIIKTGALAA